MDQWIRVIIMQNITYKNFDLLLLHLKGYFTLKLEILSSFTLVFFLWLFLLSWNHKEDILKIYSMLWILANKTHNI